MKAIIEANDVSNALAGKKVILLLEPQRRQFYIDSIRKIIDLSNESFIEFKCVLLFHPKRIWSIGPKNKVRREITNQYTSQLQNFSSQYRKFTLELKPLRTSWRDVTRVLLRPNRNLGGFSDLYNSTLSIAYSSQYIPEWAIGLPRFRLYKLKIQSSIKWRKSWIATSETLSTSGKNSLVIFLNGRLPGQAAIREYCENNGTEFLVLEQGTPKNEKFHIQFCQTQDTYQLRQINLARLENLMKDDTNRLSATAWGIEWLRRQMGSEQNRFAIWERPDRIEDSGSLNSLFDKEPKIATFFNSSLEERFSNKGMELNGWKNQAEAFRHSMQVAKEEGFFTILRIHPNYTRKNIRNLSYLLARVQKFSDIIIFPWEAVSTPRLIAKSNVVVTWGSTVSLESTFNGTPTIMLGRTTYDNLIDVKICHKDDVTVAFKELTTPSSEKSAIATFLGKNSGLNLESKGAYKRVYDKKLNNRVRVYFSTLLALIVRGRNITPRDLLILFGPFLGEKKAVSFLQKTFKIYLFICKRINSR